MKEGRPSLTAFYVAYARALASYEPELSRACQDEYAEELLPRPIARLLARARRSPATLALLRSSAFGMSEHLAVRTRLIDDAVSQAVREGARQLVVLGAGLDARAHRLPQLRDVIVFEVDHPSTQTFKREKARHAKVMAKELRYVTCDFERETFVDALRTAGFDAHVPSVWIWEGVTMYLPSAVVESSLRMISASSAAHSRLIATYLTPAPPRTRHLEAAGLAVLGALSEPVHSHFERAEMARLLRAYGFVSLTDVSPRAIAGRYGVRFPRFAIGAPSERVIVAEKRLSPIVAFAS